MLTGMDLPPVPVMNWDDEFGTPPKTGIHFHGFTWKGHSSRIFSMKYAAERRPGCVEFETGDTPAEGVSENLLRPRLVRASFFDAREAEAWALEVYAANKPAVYPSHKTPENSAQFVRCSIERGTDMVWRWDLPHPGAAMCFMVVLCCCPNGWSPGIPCPTDPGATLRPLRR